MERCSVFRAVTYNGFRPAYRFSCRGVHFRKRKKQGPALRRIRSVPVQPRGMHRSFCFPSGDSWHTSSTADAVPLPPLGKAQETTVSLLSRRRSVRNARSISEADLLLNLKEFLRKAIATIAFPSGGRGTASAVDEVCRGPPQNDVSRENPSEEQPAARTASFMKGSARRGGRLRHPRESRFYHCTSNRSPVSSGKK